MAGRAAIPRSLLNVVLHDSILRRDPHGNAQAADSEVFRAATALPRRLGSPWAKGARRYPDSTEPICFPTHGYSQLHGECMGKRRTMQRGVETSNISGDGGGGG
jgi:hypothetical protein